MIYLTNLGRDCDAFFRLRYVYVVRHRPVIFGKFSKEVLSKAFGQWHRGTSSCDCFECSYVGICKFHLNKIPLIKTKLKKYAILDILPPKSIMPYRLLMQTQSGKKPESAKITKAGQEQCDHIEQFIVLWATFQSLRLQLFSPNCPHS